MEGTWFQARKTVISLVHASCCHQDPAQYQSVCCASYILCVERHSEITRPILLANHGLFTKSNESVTIRSTLILRSSVTYYMSHRSPCRMELSA